MFVTIEDIRVEIVHKSIKNVNLRIYPPDGQVKLSVPLKYKDRYIQKLLSEKLAWIREKQNLIRAREYPINKVLKTGSTIYIFGKSYLLLVEELQGPSTIRIQDHLIFCYIKPGTAQPTIEKAFKNWYKSEMANILPELIKKWEPIINVEIAQWGIKQMKTRWGTCNTRDKRIWLNLNLIHKPLICLEYVLVHEMVHLLEASHNKRFYELMSRFLPDWKKYQALLEGVYN